MIIRDCKIVACLTPRSDRKQTIPNRLQAVKAIQQFKRIKLPKGETITDLIAEGRH